MGRYRVKDMGRGFDGLTVEGSFRVYEDRDEEGEVVYFLAVEKIINDHVVFGDRNVGFPVPSGSLFINEIYLETLDDEQKEYSAEFPFGVEITTYRLSREKLEVVLTQYERALAVTVLEKIGTGTTRTLFSQNYVKWLDETRNKIHDLFLKNDMEDLVFELKELKAQEKK